MVEKNSNPPDECASAEGGAPASAPGSMRGRDPMSRRGLIQLGALSMLGWAARPRTALGAVAINTGEPPGDILVNIFLRGGADGLNLVVPYGDDDYYRNRPTLGISAPRNSRSSETDRVIPLDSFFGLNPALHSLRPLYEQKQLAVIHACGSGDQTRSHFEAMDTVERGVFRQTGPASGWLARHLESAPWTSKSPLRAVAIGEIVPASLQGAGTATAMRTLSDFRIDVPPGKTDEIARSLASLYGGDKDLLMEAGHETLRVLAALSHLDAAHTAAGNGAVYPVDELGAGLRQVALLIKSDVGLEAACLDHGSFDTHVAQAGILSGKLMSLGDSLAAFAKDLGPDQWKRTTVVVVSEFGRRVEENSGAGTDHGRAGVMFVLGGNPSLQSVGSALQGGRVNGTWPGLAPEQLEGPGDLRVTTDYRSVLAEVIRDHLKNPRVDVVFPGLAQQGMSRSKNSMMDQVRARVNATAQMLIPSVKL